MNTYWGKHLVLNCSNCELEKIKDPLIIYKFAVDIVKAINMVAYGEPWIVHFGTGNKAGYTLVQLIETSNICAHFSEDERSAYIDIFSCAEFDENVAIDVACNAFKFTHADHTILYRKA